MKLYPIKFTLYSILCLMFLSACGSPGPSSGGSPSTGGTSGGGSTVSQSGSTAAMLIHQNALYILDSYLLKVFDISNGDETKKVSQHVISGAETLFVYDNYLYVGGQFGVDIWNIEDALSPVQENFYQHARACDPVIVHDDIGYITLRNRTNCRGQSNRLEVVDFSDPTDPQKLVEFPMQNPYGLAKMGDYLAVCQERFGLSILNVTLAETESTKTASVEEVSSFNEINCFDMIFNNNILLVTAQDGIYQLAVDGYWVSFLSKISIGS